MRALLVLERYEKKRPNVRVCKYMGGRLKGEESKGKERAQDKSKNLARFTRKMRNYSVHRVNHVIYPPF
jgi:hypothetical protein